LEAEVGGATRERRDDATQTPRRGEENLSMKGRTVQLMFVLRVENVNENGVMVMKRIPSVDVSREK
jgi:hypothetical protein